MPHSGHTHHAHDGDENTAEERRRREREHAAFPKAPNVMKVLKPVCLLAEAKELPPAVLWEYNFLNRENYNFNMLQFVAASEGHNSNNMKYPNTKL